MNRYDMSGYLRNVTGEPIHTLRGIGEGVQMARDEEKHTLLKKILAKLGLKRNGSLEQG